MLPVSIHILAGPADANFLGPMVQHLVLKQRTRVEEVLLTLDTSETSRYPKESRAIAALTSRAKELQKSGLVDRVISLEKESGAMRIWSKRHFGRTPQSARDHRGIPLFGWISGFENCRSEYLFHADSDILIHDAGGGGWLSEGLRLLERDETAMFVAPWPGPPREDNQLLGQSELPRRSESGNIYFKSFSSRRFLVKRSRYEQLLPLSVAHSSWKSRIMMMLGNGSSILPWESLVSSRLATSPFHRVHVPAHMAWTLHCPDHGPAWLKCLDSIIKRVEDGHFPPEQAGSYDLKIEHW